MDVTQDGVEKHIVQEFFFTAAAGVYGEAAFAADSETKVSDVADPSRAFRGLSFIMCCVLITDFGMSFVGTAVAQSEATYDEKKGEAAARADAIRKLWPAVVAVHKQRAHEAAKDAVIVDPPMFNFSGTSVRPETIASVRAQVAQKAAEIKEPDKYAKRPWLRADRQNCALPSNVTADTVVDVWYGSGKKVRSRASCLYWGECTTHAECIVSYAVIPTGDVPDTDGWFIWQRIDRLIGDRPVFLCPDELIYVRLASGMTFTYLARSVFWSECPNSRDNVVAWKRVKEGQN